MGAQGGAAAAPIRWIAHRGCAAGRPWGTPTRETLEMAVRLGVEVVEIDVRTTSDDVLVVRHDAINGRRQRPLSYAEVLMADPVVLTVAQADRAVGGRSRLLFDLKDERSTEQIGRWLAAQPHPERYIVCSPRVEDLARLRVLAPTVERWVTFPDVGVGGAGSVRRVLAAINRRHHRGEFSRMARDLGRAIRDIRRERNAAIAEVGGIPWRDALPAELPHLIRATGCSGVSVHQWLVTPELVQEAHRLGIGVTAWTVNRPDALAAMVDAGADHITTDDVEGMRARLPMVRRMVERDRAERDARIHLLGLVRRLRADSDVARGLPGE